MIQPHQRRQLTRFIQRMRANAKADAQEIVRATTSIIIGDPGTGGGGTGGGTTLTGGDLSGRVNAALVIGLQARPVSSIPPTTGQALIWDGAKWVGGSPGAGIGSLIDYSTLTNEALTGSGATATASSFHAAVPGVSADQLPAYLIDNFETTFWESAWGVSGGPFTGVDGQWAEVDLGSAKPITYFRVGIFPGYGPPTWKLQSSTDDATWTDRFSGTGDDDTGIVALAGSPITARYWRVLATSEDTHGPGPNVAWYIKTIALYSGTALTVAPRDLSYVHTQGSASTTWTVVHDLGKFPSVSVIAGGSLVYADVAHIDANNLVITFSAATSGVAYMN